MRFNFYIKPLFKYNIYILKLNFNVYETKMVG